jgi:hypothetical protein
MRNMNKKNLEMAKFIVSIGEAVYSAWLGAFAEDRAHSEFLDICPYDHSQLEWRAPAAIRASFEREGGRRSCGTRRHSLIGSTSVSGWQKKTDRGCKPDGQMSMGRSWITASGRGELAGRRNDEERNEPSTKNTTRIEWRRWMRMSARSTRQSRLQRQHRAKLAELKKDPA